MSTPAGAGRAAELLAGMMEHFESSEVGLLFAVDAVEQMTETLLVLRGNYAANGRPGADPGNAVGVTPGPIQMAMADGFGWMLTVDRMPPGSDAFTIDMSMQFLRPLPVGPFVARCELLRWSPRRSVTTTQLSPGPDGPTSTFITAAFSPRSSAG